MKDFSFQLLNNRSRKTVSDLKLKKSIQLTSEDLNRINNSYKFRQTKLSPIVGEITGIPIKPESAIIRQMLIGKQVTKLQIPFKRLKTVQQPQIIYSKPKFNQNQIQKQIQKLLTQSTTVEKEANQKQQEGAQLDTASLRKKPKTPRKITPKIVGLPKIIQPKYQLQKKQDKPLLTAIDANLKGIKSLHYFICEHQTKSPIIAYRSKTKIQVASLTKIMTFYTVYKICEIYNLNLKLIQLQIEEQMTGITGTTANLQQHQVYTVEQLLYGMMLPSGNDASVALAMWGGKIIFLNKQYTNQIQVKPNYIKIFVQKMNIYAKQLKMDDTTYGNPHGLPHRDNKTTCQDMAKLCGQCLNIPLFRQVVSAQIYKIKVYHQKFKKKLQICWENTNKLLRRPGFIGIKTGITVTAGPCLASAYQFIGKIYIVIIAKCNKPSRRFKQTRKLLVHCLERISHSRPLNQEEEKQLKKLGKKNEDIDSDYSQQQLQFNFASFSYQEIQRRTRTLTQL